MGKERVAAARESLQSVLDQVACGRITRRAFFASLAGASAVALLGRAAVEEALAAGERQAKQAAALPNSFDLIVVGGGSSGCVGGGTRQRECRSFGAAHRSGTHRQRCREYRESEHLVHQHRRTL